MTNKRIVLASNNAGKIREIGQLLANLDYEVIPQAQLGVDEADETGLTFVENAILKARHAATQTGLAAIADDSGIEVDALQGAPGIYSARYADGRGDTANNQKLLEALQGVPDAERTARFRCVIVHMRHAADPMPQICEGTWEGRILHEQTGANGFGYDPLFYVPTHNCASAELDPSVKNLISHRAQALKLLLTRLSSTR